MYSVRGPEGRTTSVPMLRLQGAWLERAGFLVGRTVKVLVSSGRLIIEAVEPERVSNAEALERIAQVSEGGMPKRDLDALVRRLKQNRID
jgi:hypothetical protein